MRVIDLAKEYGVPAQEFISQIDRIGVHVTHHMNTLTEKQEAVIRASLDAPRVTEPIDNGEALRDVLTLVAQGMAKSQIDEKETLNDNDMVVVRSNVFGRLIYINHKTGEKTIWDNQGDTQEISMRDLRDMKAGQIKFFTDNWIICLGVDGKSFSPEDIYKALYVDKYYKNYINFDNFGAVCAWDISTIQERVPMLSTSAQSGLIVALNEYISNGTLDSIKKIKAFETALNCDLLEPNI